MTDKTIRINNWVYSVSDFSINTTTNSREDVDHSGHTIDQTIDNYPIFPLELPRGLSPITMPGSDFMIYDTLYKTPTLPNDMDDILDGIARGTAQGNMKYDPDKGYDMSGKPLLVIGNNSIQLLEMRDEQANINNDIIADARYALVIRNGLNLQGYSVLGKGKNNIYIICWHDANNNYQPSVAAIPYKPNVSYQVKTSHEYAIPTVQNITDHYSFDGKEDKLTEDKPKIYHTSYSSHHEYQQIDFRFSYPHSGSEMAWLSTISLEDYVTNVNPFILCPLEDFITDFELIDLNLINSMRNYDALQLFLMNQVLGSVLSHKGIRGLDVFKPQALQWICNKISNWWNSYYQWKLAPFYAINRDREYYSISDGSKYDKILKEPIDTWDSNSAYSDIKKNLLELKNMLEASNIAGIEEPRDPILIKIDQVIDLLNNKISF